jgi:hypothetical protein
MKKLLTTLLLAAASTQCFAQITWGTPATVYTGSGSNLHQRIALNRAGNPVVLWGKTDSRAYVSTWTGSAFTAPTAVNGSLTVFAQSWAGPDLAAYGDTMYVSMKVTPENVNTNYSYLAHSYNGGSTFSAPVRVDNIDTSLSRFPIVTTTSNGNPLVAFMKFNSVLGDAHYAVSRSTDYGMTFTSDVRASGAAGTVCDCCPATIISSGSKAIMLFRNNLSNIRDIWAGVSPDGGATFPTTMSADNTNWNITSCPASGPDGFVIGDSIYSVFYSAATGTSLAYLSRTSMSTGFSATAPFTGTFSGLLSQNYPRVANAGNSAAAVWLQNTSSGNGIAFAFTSNISAGFPGYSAVPSATGSGIMNADVAMSPGVIHVVWQDNNTNKVMYVKGTYPATTSVTTTTPKQLIEIYPNPASKSFSINIASLNGLSYCYLTDMTGRQIPLKAAINSTTATCSLSGIARGNYFFVAADNDGKGYFSKLIVE